MGKMTDALRKAKLLKEGERAGSRTPEAGGTTEEAGTSEVRDQEPGGSSQEPEGGPTGKLYLRGLIK